MFYSLYVFNQFFHIWQHVIKARFFWSPRIPLGEYVQCGAKVSSHFQRKSMTGAPAATFSAVDSYWTSENRGLTPQLFSGLCRLGYRLSGEAAGRRREAEQWESEFLLLPLC